MFWRIILLVIAIMLLTLNARKQIIERIDYLKSRGFSGNIVAAGLGTFIAVCINWFLSWYIIDFFINLMK
jgi:hypothetical protein